MSDAIASLRRTLEGAVDLQAVVRTMKALAAANITQYEQSTHALTHYVQAVNLGLGACFRQHEATVIGSHAAPSSAVTTTLAVVFGSDQGLVGQFNEVVADHARRSLAGRPGKVLVWAVGARVHARLSEAADAAVGCFEVPASVHAIAPLVGRILMECQPQDSALDTRELVLFHHRTAGGVGFEPVTERLLPLDVHWRRALAAQAWPTHCLPQVMDDPTATLGALLREYLFISLYRACAESLASENACRLAAMQRADRNIDEMLAQLHGTIQRVRQGSIDEELFDVIAGFEALTQ